MKQTVITIFASLATTNALAIDDTQMFNCISQNLPTSNWQQMLTDFNTDETHQSWSHQVADAAVTCYDQFSNDLPTVCAGGRRCRNGIRDRMHEQIIAVWVKVFDQITQTLNTRRTLTENAMKNYWQRSYDCKPGCACNNMGVTHDSLLTRQEGVYTKSKELVAIRCNHYCQALIYKESCAEFALPSYEWASECRCGECEPVECGTNETQDPDTCECTISTVRTLMLVNTQTTKPLQIKGASTAAGAGVEIGTKNKGPAQEFILEHVGETQNFRIKNVNSGLYLTMGDRAVQQMTQQAYQENGNQLFFFESAQKRIKETKTNLVIDIEGANSRDGTRIIGYPGHSNWNQKWIIEYI